MGAPGRVVQRFDPHQPHQLGAVASVVDLFDGAVVTTDPSASANALELGEGRLLENLGRVQRRGGLPLDPALTALDFAVEMETGTGKTYTYLRTMCELAVRYGLRRYVIVVPSVAIREGVSSQIAATQAHFRRRYGLGISARVWSAKRPGSLRTFAEGAGVQVLVITLDAFNKRGALNVIHRPHDVLGGATPMDLIRRCRPIVVLDEPQNMESERSREAIDTLQPLVRLRYSATHRRVVHLVHRLDPVQAYDQGLVKRIEVVSVTTEGSTGDLEVTGVEPTPRGVRATVMLDVASGGRVQRRRLRVAVGDDLCARSGGRSAYRGMVVTQLDARAGEVHFQDGRIVRVGGDPSASRDALVQVQIEETIRTHLERERQLHVTQPEGRRIKVLSLFFLDRVARYDDLDGPIRRWFEEAYARIRGEPRYAQLPDDPVASVHAGWFARARGRAADTSGRTAADRDAFALIMRDKARLLSLDEPVRFIFSHSALREGWDNPNVFQICTLGLSRSELRKRQEIGRGLRLPVREDGERCRAPDLNVLTVVANESYESFARRLQTELLEETGVSLEGRIIDRRVRGELALRAGWEEDPATASLWGAVTRRSAFAIGFDEALLVARGVVALEAMAAVDGPAVRVQRASLMVDGAGVRAADQGGGRTVTRAGGGEPLPDLIASLQSQTGITRRAIARILVASGRLGEAIAHPQPFLDAAARALRQTVDDLSAETVSYRPQGGADRPLATLDHRPLDPAGVTIVPMARGTHLAMPARSAREADILRSVDGCPDVARVMPWPRWLAIATPLGPHRPWLALIDVQARIWVLERAGGGPREASRRHCAAEHCRAVGLFSLGTWSSDALRSAARDGRVRPEAGV